MGYYSPLTSLKPAFTQGQAPADGHHILFQDQGLTWRSESMLSRLRSRLLSTASPLRSRPISSRIPSMVLLCTILSLTTWFLNSSRPMSLMEKHSKALVHLRRSRVSHGLHAPVPNCRLLTIARASNILLRMLGRPGQNVYASTINEVDS